MNKKFLHAAGFGLVAAITIVLYYYFSTSPSVSSGPKSIVATVEMTSGGFVPSELLITKGQTVRFFNSDSKEHWPASDLHPTHAIYPKFDPQEPVDQKSEWFFTFDRAGNWKFHDHLFPLFRGIVRVSE